MVELIVDFCRALLKSDSSSLVVKNIVQLISDDRDHLQNLVNDVIDYYKNHNELDKALEVAVKFDKEDLMVGLVEYEKQIVEEQRKLNDATKLAEKKSKPRSQCGGPPRVDLPEEIVQLLQHSKLIEACKSMTDFALKNRKYLKDSDLKECCATLTGVCKLCVAYGNEYLQDRQALILDSINYFKRVCGYFEEVVVSVNEKELTASLSEQVKLLGDIWDAMNNFRAHRFS